MFLFFPFLFLLLILLLIILLLKFLVQDTVFSREYRERPILAMDIPRCNISSVTHLQRGSAKWWKDVEWPVNIFAPLTTPSSKAVHAWWRKREKRLKWHPFVPRSLGQIPRCVLCIPTNEDINLNLSDCLVPFRRLV